MTARTGGSMPASAPAVARESLQGRYAGLASRFAAFVVDLVVLTGIFVLVLAAINFAASIVTGKDIAFNRGSLWVVIAYLVWGFVYFAHFWGLNGRTAGMALFGIQVLTAQGGDVSGRRGIGRTLAFPLSFLILGLGFLGVLLGDQRRALHDVIAGTVVIYSGTHGRRGCGSCPGPDIPPRSPRPRRNRPAGPARPAPPHRAAHLVLR